MNVKKALRLLEIELFLLLSNKQVKKADILYTKITIPLSQLKV